MFNKGKNGVLIKTKIDQIQELLASFALTLSMLTRLDIFQLAHNKFFLILSLCKITTQKTRNRKRKSARARGRLLFDKNTDIKNIR